MKRITTILLLCCVCATMAAHEIIIFGQVGSAVDGEPLQAANVWFKNTQIGTTTNEEGYFILRTNEPQKTLCVSVLGYRHKEVKLTGSDQVLTIALKEEHHTLSELVVIPGANEALPLMRRVKAMAAQNNPDKIGHFATTEQQSTRMSLSNIRRKALQRKALREVQQGVLATDDSVLFVPLYDAVVVNRVEVDTIQGSRRTNISTDQKALRILPPDQIGIFMANYAPNVNFYRNNVTVLQTNFVSPLAAQGNVYYQYFLVDSVQTDTGKQYYLHFRPKNDKELCFKGEMWIDSATCALTHIKASLPPAAAINYVTGLHIEQTFAPCGNGRFYYDQAHYSVAFSFNIFDKNAQHGTAVVYEQQVKNAPIILSDEIAEKPDFIDIFPDTTTAEDAQFRTAIDSLNNSKLQRLAYAAVDFILYGYIHAWKFDFGPVIDYLRYNKLEGVRPTFAMRTGQAMCDKFTVGGYFGYGFGDKKWKYGGNIQARWGDKNAHSIGFFYDNDVVRHGYSSLGLVEENMYGSNEHFFTALSRHMFSTNLYQIQQARTQYRFEIPDFRLTLAAQGTNYLSNNYMQFVHDGNALKNVQVLSAAADVRIAFGERSLDGYFKRFYLNNDKPVISIRGEYGWYQAGEQAGHFGNVHAAVKQNVPISSGKFIYCVEGGWLFGNVPWLLLESPRAQHGLWNGHSFATINPLEFMTDAYLYTNLEYVTSGWLFNYIPSIKKLNLREQVLCNMAYGGLRTGHNSVLDLPDGVTSLQKMPYIELGVGICNIFRLFAVQSVWRITHRNDPDATKWAIRLRFELGL